MELVLSTCRVRSYRPEDAESLARHANNRKVWLGLRDAFPYPYTLANAQQFIAMALSKTPESFFALEVEGEAAGGIGFTGHTDVERLTAEVGYWLGEAYWGRGIVTEAVTAFTRYVVATFGLVRLYAVPYAHNKASSRVLSKAGYVMEGVLRRSVIKDGVICDQHLWAYVVENPSSDLLVGPGQDL